MSIVKTYIKNDSLFSSDGPIYSDRMFYALKFLTS